MAKVFFDTLGCAKNLVDTSNMEEVLIHAGHSVVDHAKEADVIVLNTCAFIEVATQESIDTFFQYRNFYKDKKILVVGCLVSRYKNELCKSMPEADGFLPCKDEDNIAKAIDNLAPGKTNSQTMRASSSQAFAYVKISEGCNRRCSYCTIPYIRGKYKSSRFEEILSDVAKAVENNAKEIVLVAQDCGVWGQDFNKTLADLLNKLCPVYPDVYFRLLYVYPETIDDNLINCIKNNKNIRRYIDMPVQHASKDILKAMGRKGSEKDFLELISKLRKEISEIHLRSTVIAGFPGETDKDFEELKNFIEMAKFDYLGCFEYSQEEGTKAADMIDQIPNAIKYSRANEIREVADSISLERLQEKVGQNFEVLIEGKEDGRYFGRAYFQAPDVDGYIFISEYDDKKVQPGQLVNVKIQDCEGYDLVGVLDEQ